MWVASVLLLTEATLSEILRRRPREAKMFRSFWVCSGVHGSRDSLGWLRQAVARKPPDAILFSGGILAPSHDDAVNRTPWRLSRQDCRFIEEFFTVLGELGVFSAVLPGLEGEPLDQFLRLGMQAELTFPTVHSAHATLIEAGDLALSGIGVVVGESRVLGMDSYSRTSAEYFLRPLWQARQPRKVLLLSAPPTGPLGGPRGSALIGELIDSFYPGLCVVGGESQWRGSERIGHTLVINPGCLADGWAAWLDWRRASQDQVEFVNLRNLQPTSVAGKETAGASVQCVPSRPPPLEGAVSKDAVRLRAYLRWEAAGKPEGSGTRFWHEAEEELRQELTSMSTEGGVMSHGREIRQRPDLAML